MNEVQEYILKRAMQKLANAEEQKKLKDLPKTMPKDYYAERYSAYDNLAYTDDTVLPKDVNGEYEDLWDLVYRNGKPDFNNLDVNYLRINGAKNYLRGMRLQEGSNKWNQALKYLLNHGKINQYNYLNPEDPMDVPKVDNKIFNEKEQKQLQEGGPTIAYNNNYKKFSGNA